MCSKAKSESRKRIRIGSHRLGKAAVRLGFSQIGRVIAKFHDNDTVVPKMGVTFVWIQSM